MSTGIGIIALAALGWGVAFLFLLRILWLERVVRRLRIAGSMAAKWVITIGDLEEDVEYFQEEARAAKRHNLRQARQILSLDTTVLELHHELRVARGEIETLRGIVADVEMDAEIKARVADRIAELANSPQPTESGDRLVAGIHRCFNNSELDQLAQFYFDVMPDDIGGDTLVDRCGWLVGYCQRRGYLGRLVDALARERPHIDWG